MSISISRGEVHALVGESGSGKSVTARSILRLDSADTGVEIRGEVLYDGSDIYHLREDELRSLRGDRIAMVFQEPTRYLNPSLRIGEQIGEVIEAHMERKPAQVRARVMTLLDEVGLPSRVARQYPHQLSGGMSQRVMIAMALTCEPDFLIADEPTTSLDVTIQKQILALLARLRVQYGMGVLFISHDLAVVESIAQRISVMYAGRIVESGGTGEILASPLHPYTQALIGAVPEAGRRGSRLVVIPGRPPDSRNIPPGCAFHPRCPLAGEVCSRVDPEMRSYGGQVPHTAACHMIRAGATSS
ncbi:MAG TPA: ABC transporter ATP-binding protein [Spirochaetia bacterium]|nr:ABC transporter ATP-binding protein [Spirochaetia bacterium]